VVAPVRFLYVCGPSGAGKSSVGYEIFRQLVAEGVTAAYLDFDQIGLCRPAPADDRDNLRMSAANLAAIWPNFRRRGTRCLITSGIVHTNAQIQAYADAVPDAPLTACRLRAGRDVLRERILLRGSGGGPLVPGNELRGQSTQWLLEAAADSAAEADEMERNDLGDFCVDTDAHGVEEVAQLVRARAGL
jgi:hypothetical protein